MKRLVNYVLEKNYDRPTVVLDLDIVEENYNKLKLGICPGYIHYAVKANPQQEILQRLVTLGSRFDAASMGEIVLCIEAGASPEHISFGNTVKRIEDIKYAYMCGIRLFAVDSVEEIIKVATHAPGADVFVRILVTDSQAEWPLSRKFGCHPEYALTLMDIAKDNGLGVAGISFHVGSQTRHPEMWDTTFDVMSKIWHTANTKGHALWLLNIGGGFPSYYGVDITDPITYGKKLNNAINEKFGDVKYIMAEPGRGLVASAGVIAAEVLLVAKKHPDDTKSWVYLNIGRFSGLSETEGEAIKYQFIFPDCKSTDTIDCILAGPTCDSADILYEKTNIKMPADIKSGDRIIIKTTGAYTTTYSTVAFNGFPPLFVEVI